MKRALLTGLVMAAAGATMGGCTVGRYRSQPLGPVPYAQAFCEAERVFCQYFSVAESNPGKGRIIGRPKVIEAGPGPLGGTTASRRQAQMRIRRKRTRQSGWQVIAEIRVQIERQDMDAFVAFYPITVNNELPTQAPVLESGALTAEQNQAWEVTGRDEALERAILRDLVERIAACRQPTP